MFIAQHDAWRFLQSQTHSNSIPFHWEKILPFPPPNKNIQPSQLHLTQQRASSQISMEQCTTFCWQWLCFKMKLQSLASWESKATLTQPQPQCHLCPQEIAGLIKGLLTTCLSPETWQPGGLGPPDQIQRHFPPLQVDGLRGRYQVLVEGDRSSILLQNKRIKQVTKGIKSDLQKTHANSKTTKNAKMPMIRILQGFFKFLPNRLSWKSLPKAPLPFTETHEIGARADLPREICTSVKLEKFGRWSMVIISFLLGDSPGLGISNREMHGNFILGSFSRERFFFRDFFNLGNEQASVDMIHAYARRPTA